MIRNTDSDARMAPARQEHRDMVYEYRAGHIPRALFLDMEALPIAHRCRGDAAPGSVCGNFGV